MPKILVVDDNPVVVDVLKRFLEGKHYEVVTASKGSEAVQKVQEENPKVVLLDVHMPGKSGLAVLKEIKQFNQDVGVIMVTAVADEAVGRQALNLGAWDYIIKPFGLEYLERVLWQKLKTLD